LSLAARRAEFFRATFAPSLASALDRCAEPQARNAFSDRLEAGVRQRMTDHRAAFNNIVATLSVEKI
jgi:hypothetical protein